MKITKVETIQIEEFFHVLWVQIHTDNGMTGLGETWYLPRAVASVIHEAYAPMLVGRDPMDREALWAEMGYDAEQIEEFKAQQQPGALGGALLDFMRGNENRAAVTPEAEGG